MLPVGKLSREELLKREIEIRDLIESTKKKPPLQPAPRFAPNLATQYSKFGFRHPYRSGTAPGHHSKNHGPPSSHTFSKHSFSSTFPTSHQNSQIFAPSNKTHNRVFVRKPTSTPTIKKSKESTEEVAQENFISLEPKSNGTLASELLKRDNQPRIHLTIGETDSEEDEEAERHRVILCDILAGKSKLKPPTLEQSTRKALQKEIREKAALVQAQRRLLSSKAAQLKRSPSKIPTASAVSGATKLEQKSVQRTNLKIEPAKALIQGNLSTDFKSRLSDQRSPIKRKILSKFKLQNATKDNTKAQGVRMETVNVKRLEMRTPRKRPAVLTRFKLQRSKVTKKPVARRKILRIPRKSPPQVQSLLMVRGVPFQSSKDGKVLKRINTALRRRKSTKVVPKSLMKFASLQPPATGTLTKVASQLINRSIFKLNRKKKAATTLNRKDCIFFIRFGKCHKGDSCKFVHDSSKVSICTKFLRGSCKTENCPFSHKVDKDKMPLCLYFQQGKCTTKHCPYRHSYFRKDVPYCPDFLKGFCAKGQMCNKQHVLVCTDDSCKRDPKICPLYHKPQNSQSKPKRQKKLKKLVARNGPDSKGAWPEFVNLSGSDSDEDIEVQVEMPSRTTNRLQRFLDRKSRPKWPDYSLKGISPPENDARILRIGHRIRQIVKKARWLRRVRPIRLPGDFISFVIEAPPEEPLVPEALETPPKAPTVPEAITMDFDQDLFDILDLDESSDSSTYENELMMTYGDAIKQKSLNSDHSISSYTTPDMSSVESCDEAEESQTVQSMFTSENWQFEFLREIDRKSQMFYVEATHEQGKFRNGNRIRKLLRRYRRRRRKQGLLHKDPNIEAGEFIPLCYHEEGEIFSDEDVALCDDHDVIDMDLGSDVETEVTLPSIDDNPDEKSEIDVESRNVLSDPDLEEGEII